MAFMDSSSFLRQELKRLYERNLNVQKYFLRLRLGCDFSKGRCDYPKKYWMDVKEDFVAFLSQKNIPFEWDFHHRMFLHKLTIEQDESALAKQKIEIMIFENKIDVRYDLDSSLKKGFSFDLVDAPIARKLVVALYRDALKDLGGEIKTIKDNFKELYNKVSGMSEKSVQIAASSIEAICKSQFKDGQAKVYTRDYDAIIKSNDKQIRVFYADFLNDPQAFIKSLTG